jgi:putative transcriptional regulator
MGIIVRLDVMLALRKAKSKDLAAFLGITETNLSLLKSGRVKGVRFETLDGICRFPPVPAGRPAGPRSGRGDRTRFLVDPRVTGCFRQQAA